MDKDTPDFRDAISASFPYWEADLTIAPGHHVRSFDFAGVLDSFVEGIVEAITEPIEGCPRYKIRVIRKVFQGTESREAPDFVFPPVNGTPTWTDKQTNYVVRIFGQQEKTSL